ncbi:hypothetical protein Tco_1222263 [Tanacetum coccineum]
MLRDPSGIPLLGIKTERCTTVHETEILRCGYPLRKRLCRTTPGPGCAFGERFGSCAARQFDLPYLRQTFMDLLISIQEIAPTTLEGVNQRVIELSTTVDQEDEIIYSHLDDARYNRALLRARVNRLDSDRPFHKRTALLIEEEARLTICAWARVDGCLRLDYRRQRQLVETLKIVKSLKAQMTELQRQQGPAKDPAEPELPEEAGSSS